jgi:hypothetical protein
MPQVKIHYRRIKQQTIEQVEYASNSGEKFARILYPGFTFEQRFDQIADHRTDA